MKINHWGKLIFCALGLAACSDGGQSNSLADEAGQASALVVDVVSAEVPKIKNTPMNMTYTTIEWTDLMPTEDLDALLNPPEYLDSIEDGSQADVIDDQLKTKSVSANDARYEQALVSTTIRPEFNNKAIRLPGFIVPLEFDGAQTITAFFLVPFFGACIHLPPPPPNQIIYAEYKQGIKLESLYDPFWIEGILTTTLIENDTATAAYAITVDHFEPYTEE
jgi:hypothetical protein